MGMSLEQFLLLKLSEELGEVQKNIAKAMQFGLDDTEPGQQKDNGMRIYAELNDVLASVKMLNESVNTSFNFEKDEQAIVLKCAKVHKYLQYSCDLGFVDSTYLG